MFGVLTLDPGVWDVELGIGRSKEQRPWLIHCSLFRYFYVPLVLKSQGTIGAITEQTGSM